MCHGWRPSHQRIDHMALKYVGYALGAGYLMRQNSGRTLACGSSHLAHPYADSLAHVARRELKPLESPISLTSGVVEARFTVQGYRDRRR